MSFVVSPYFDEWLISHSRATLAPLLRIKTDLFPFGENPLNSMKGIKVQIVLLTYAEETRNIRCFANSKWYISSILGVYRILPHTIYTMYISRDFNSCFLLVGHLSVFSRSSVGRMHYPYNKQSTKTTAIRNEQRWKFKRLND